MVLFGVDWQGMALNGTEFHWMTWRDTTALHGVVLFCKVLHSNEWRCMAWCGIALHGMVRYGVAWYRVAEVEWRVMMWHCVAWCCIELHDIVWVSWCFKALHCIEWRGMVLDGVAWHDITWYSTGLHCTGCMALHCMSLCDIAWHGLDVVIVHTHCCWDSRFGVLPRRAITLFTGSHPTLHWASKMEPWVSFLRQRVQDREVCFQNYELPYFMCLQCSEFLWICIRALKSHQYHCRWLRRFFWILMALEAVSYTHLTLPTKA